MSPVERLAGEFLDEWFAEYPTFASIVGAEGHDGDLGDFSAAAFDRRDRRTRHWLDTLSALDGDPSPHDRHDPTDDPAGLDDQVDRDAMIAYLRGELVTAEVPAWRRDPGMYLLHCLFGVNVLFWHRLYPEPELAAAAESRLRQVPGVLDHARRNLDPDLAAPLVVRRAAAMATGGAALAREVVPGEVDDPALRARLAEAGAVAGEAFADLAGWLEEFAGKARGDWRLGERRYTELLRQRELLDFDAAGLREHGWRAYRELDAQMREVAARVPGGSADWRSVMETLNADHPPTPEAMREEYERVTRRARDFLVEHDLVSFGEGEQCLVVPGPVFSRAVNAVASYLPPPLLRGVRTGRFNVPYPPGGATDEQVEQRLRTNSRASMPTIVAHEAYPGHHWHLSWLVGMHRPIRAVLGTPFFSEGWGLYAEHVMREHGFFADPAQELAHLDARIFRAARIVVDTSLHCGDMDLDQAVEFMTTRVSLSAGTARSEVERYCSTPTQAAAYLTGALEIERIRARWRERRPNAPLREFHDALAGTGELPLGLVERLVLR
ncbi:MAG TPA: DUF885 domain-containing protein [Mycobacteriales bacterium]|nr:DUF885 domain-containing protein [Mycobacteriales bacterium]